jgi:hypothetical protein
MSLEEFSAIEWHVFMDERGRVRSACDIATDMANVGFRHCRIGLVRLQRREGNGG